MRVEPPVAAHVIADPHVVAAIVLIAVAIVAALVAWVLGLPARRE